MAQTLRILHLYRRFRPDFTGDGIYYERLIPLMMDLGTEHSVLVFETAGPNGNVTGFPIHYLNAKPRRRSWISLAFWLWKNSGSFEVLHIHSHVDRTFLSYWVARALGLKVVYSSTLEDSIDDILERYRPSFRGVARVLSNAIQFFVGISPRLYSGRTSRFRDRATVIPQGVFLPSETAQNSSAERDLVRASLGIPADSVIVLYVGSICARKGVRALAEAFFELSSSDPRAHLVLVGPVIEPDYATELFGYIADHHLGSRVSHVSYADDPGLYYRSADIFAFGSHSEGFGNVLLEAMSYGLPVVSRYIEDVTDTFIEHEYSGYLFSTQEAFVQELRTLVQDAALRRRVGERAREVVKRNFVIDHLAKQYVSFYSAIVRTGALPEKLRQDPSLINGCRTLSAGPAAAGMRLVKSHNQTPTLVVVVDTESEFVWSKGVGADKGSVASIEKLKRAQTIFDKYGVHPCYVVDFPVISNPASAATIREFLSKGAEIGVHLQPWTTPPLVEPRDSWHAFPGNLSANLERQKLERLLSSVKRVFNVTPRVYKAGRYGISHASLRLIEEVGFNVDLSIAPNYNYSKEGGPDFSAFSSSPYWFGHSRQLLELPTTSGFVGTLDVFGISLWEISERRVLEKLRLRGLLDRLGLLSRVRLSPEAYSAEDMTRLTHSLMRRGCRYFTLSFHSSSLEPGFTPYSKTQADTERILGELEAYLEYFTRKLGGRVSTPCAIYDAELTNAQLNRQKTQTVMPGFHA